MSVCVRAASGTACTDGQRDVQPNTALIIVIIIIIIIIIGMASML